MWRAGNAGAHERWGVPAAPLELQCLLQVRFTSACPQVERFQAPLIPDPPPTSDSQDSWRFRAFAAAATGPLLRPTLLRFYTQSR